jgi:CelD/BcsL family acetyltransferase involved in cellulose biosynthesis
MSSAPLRMQATVPDVAVVTTKEEFRSLEREWNALVTAHNNILFLRHEFLFAWLESFAPDASLFVLTGRSSDGRLVAALPLIRERANIRGIPVRQLSSMSNEHSCRFDMIAEDSESAGRSFINRIAADDDWDVLRIGDVPEHGQAWGVYGAAMREGFPVGMWESQRSPYLPLPASEEELQGHVSSQSRSSARRRFRQMEKRGLVALERLVTTNHSSLQDFFKLENSGWKGRRGTACLQEGPVQAFYARFAEVAAEHGWLTMFRLSLESETVAFHYGLTYDNCYFLPKLAFNEEYSDLSPGLVLMHEVILDCIARKIAAVDFLGSDDEWKVRWSRKTLAHDWLYVFRNNVKGRLLHSMKFKWGPWVRELVRGPKMNNEQ